MAGVKFSTYMRSTKMRKALGEYVPGSLVGYKNYVKILTGDFQVYVKGISRVKSFKTISTSAGEAPVSTELGRQPEVIQLVGVPRAITSSTKLHSFDALKELLNDCYIKRTAIDPSITLIGSLNNIFIPGMLFEVLDETNYLHFPTHTRWILQEVQSDRTVQGNRTYIQYTWTLHEWPSKNPDGNGFRYIEDEYQCPNCPNPWE
ncbi:MAG: hypothetical protein BWY47_00134 [Bacteroidetes bacterium ADurb.Bin302]|nr:MAG: hypothetical protein BWY47_00134 [Bacteroidetes bacterium ADurb.Bin302]